MSDLFQFVDSISATPTVRLNLSSAPWLVHRDTQLGPPPMKRSVTSTMLRDGEYVGATAYGNRELQMVLLLDLDGNDAIATELQKLARELDRQPGNILKWQPEGATQPVFFRTFRSSPDSIIHDPGLRTVSVDILAEPFALGLREDLGPFTVNNDPAAVSNPQRFDLTGIKGDVETPLVFEYTASTGVGFPGLAYGIRPGSSPYPVTFRQAESFALGTDTSGAADATASGGNVARVSFATATAMTLRLGPSQFPVSGILGPEFNGSYRLFGRFKQSNGADVIKVVCGGDLFQGSTVTLTSQTAAQVVELGVYHINGDDPGVIGYGSTSFSMSQSGAVGLLLSAQRVSGSGSLDIDYFTLVPTSYRYGVWDDLPVVASGAGVIDAIRETAQSVSNTTTTPTRYPRYAAFIGGYPYAPPGDSRVYVIHPRTPSNDTDTITSTFSFTVRYWPRYIHVRPATT